MHIRWRGLELPSLVTCDTKTLTGTYGKFVAGLKAADIELDRKILADLAVRDSATFGRIAELAKSA